jgi:hypothetical protein
VGLQLLENKVLSRGITRKSACILTEITIRNSQVEASDEPVALLVFHSLMSEEYRPRP